MKYRIMHHGEYFICQRKRWFGWQTLCGVGNWVLSHDEGSTGPWRCNSVKEAEEAIKTVIIVSGIRRAHTRVCKTIPPWS